MPFYADFDYAIKQDFTADEYFHPVQFSPKPWQSRGTIIILMELIGKVSIQLHDFAMSTIAGKSIEYHHICKNRRLITKKVY